MAFNEGDKTTPFGLSGGHTTVPDNFSGTFIHSLIALFG